MSEASDLRFQLIEKRLTLLAGDMRILQIRFNELEDGIKALLRHFNIKDPDAI